MGLHSSFRRAVAVGVTCLACMALSSCFLAPGKFTSRLELKRDGSFAYMYNGQIHMLAMDKLSEMGNAAGSEFSPECFDEENFEDRECSAAEIAEQKAEHEARQASKERDQAEQAAMASTMMGGLNPNDPEAIEEFVAGLRRQKGWDRVEYQGDGLFDVTFSIAGDLNHDFLFPTIEGFPLSNYFVMVALRDDGEVRVDAPGFGGQGGSNPMQGMMAGMAASGSGEGKDMPNLPELDGVFTLVTDGTIKANNTDEGPVAQPGYQQLSWRVTGRSTSAPTALIDLTP